MTNKFSVSFVLVMIASLAMAHHENTPEEDQIHAYILDHPEVILEALERLTERQERLARANQIAAFPDLFERAPVLGLGSTSAPRRVVEFFDYKCIPCRSIHARLDVLVSENPELRVEMRQLPILTPASEQATRFAMGVWHIAGDDAYAAAHDALWAHLGTYNTVTFSKMAEDLGLDFAAIETAMWSDEVSQRIDANRDMAIALNIIGTPSFVTPEDIAVGTTDLERLATLFLGQ